MVINMTSFKNVLIRNIKAKRFTREYYEEIIATWRLHGYLTDEEVIEAMKVLEEVYPVQTSEEEITE